MVVPGERDRSPPNAVDPVLEVISQVLVDRYAPDGPLLRDEPVVLVVRDSLAFVRPVVLTFVGKVPEIGVLDHDGSLSAWVLPSVAGHSPTPTNRVQFQRLRRSCDAGDAYPTARVGTPVFASAGDGAAGGRSVRRSDQT
jgi:hypothetical protein